MANYYIGADVDSKMVELAIEKNGEIIRRYRVPTTIPALREVLASIPGTKFLTFEEGPMAGWLYRNLKDYVDDLIVCDPRRNNLIACDGNNIFAYEYKRMLRDGLTASNARHAIARKLLSVLWAMWKTSSRFDESLVCYSPVTVKAN